MRQPTSTAVRLALILLLSPRAGAASLTEHTVEFDANIRAYTVVRPDNLAPGAPAVVVLHGGGQSMRQIQEPASAPSRWLTLADELGIVVIMPNGFNTTQNSGTGDQQTWNDLRPTDSTTVSEEDDSGFIAFVVCREAARLAFDLRAVFVTGSSNGGMMTHRMLIEHPDLFAAGATFIANLPETEVPVPGPARPLMLMNGDADPLMPWEGGTVGVNGAPVRSTLDSVAWWRQITGATVAAHGGVLLEDTDPADGARIVEFSFLQPGASTPSVRFYRVINGGHVIPVLPGDPQNPLPPSIGNLCRDARGVDLAWAFFALHLPPAAPPADRNADGSVDAEDLYDFYRAPVDLNADGAIDEHDARFIRAYIRCAERFIPASP